MYHWGDQITQEVFLAETPEQKKRSTDTGTANALMSTNKRINKCVYCLNEQHSAEDFSKVTSIEERRGILRKYAKCFICLNAGVGPWVLIVSKL